MTHHLEYIHKLTADCLALTKKVALLEAENKTLQETIKDYDFAISVVYDEAAAPTTPPPIEEVDVEDIAFEIVDDQVTSVLKEIVESVEQKAKENACLDKLVTKRKGIPYRDSSKNTFRHNLYHLSKHVFNKPDMFVLQDFIDHPQQVIQYLMNYQGKSAKCYCRNVIDLLRCNGIVCDAYIDFRDTFVKGYTQTERPKGWQWTRVLERYEELENMEDKTYAQGKLYVILALYVELVPHRQQVYLNMEWKDSGTNNCMDLEKGLMTLRHYKTSDIYGENVYKINSKLMQILVDWKNSPISQPGIDKYLFTTKKGTPPVTNTFTNFMYQHLGVTTNQLRKLYVSDIVMPLMTNEEKTVIAGKMLHSASMQALTYSQYQQVQK